MSRRVAKKIERKIIQLHDLGMKPGDLRNKIVNDGIESGSGESVAKSTVYRVLEVAGRITRAKGRGKGGKQGQYLRNEEVLPVAAVDDTDASASYDPVLDDPAPEPPSYADLAAKRSGVTYYSPSSQQSASFPAGRIAGISEFVAGADSALAPLEEAWKSHGEVLRNLRASLDSIRVLVNALDGKDSELTRLKAEQASTQNQIKILSDQVAKWQAQAMRGAFASPGEDSLVDRG